MEEGGIILIDRPEQYSREYSQQSHPKPPSRPEGVYNPLTNNKQQLRKTFPVVIENSLSANLNLNAHQHKKPTAINNFRGMTGYFSDYGNLTILLDNTTVISNENPRNNMNPNPDNDLYMIPDVPSPHTNSNDVMTTEPSVVSVVPITTTSNFSMPKPLPSEAASHQPSSSHGRAGLDLKDNMFLHTFPLSRIETDDAPEYIDLGSLILNTDYRAANREFVQGGNGQPAAGLTVVPSVCGRYAMFNGFTTTERPTTKQPQPSALGQCSHNDDDVIFVKEYRSDILSSVEKDVSINMVAPISVRKLASCSSSTSTHSAGAITKSGKGFVPRRNPKRQAQLQKNYDVDFEFDFSVGSETNHRRKSSRDFTISNRRSQQILPSAGSSSAHTSTSSTSISSSSDSTDYMYKEWPVDGMHERPRYNPITKKLEKFDFASKSKPKRSPITTTNSTTVSKPSNFKRRPVKRKLTDKQQEALDVMINRKFASMTYETFHMILDHVTEVKSTIKLMDMIKNKSNATNTLQEQSIINDAGEILNDGDSISKDSASGVVGKNENADSMKKYLDDLQTILLDNSVLYCLANDVRQTNLAKFIEQTLEAEEELILI